MSVCVCVLITAQVDLSRVDNVCSLMLSLLCANERDESHVDFKSDPARLHPLITTTFLFGYVWGLGGNLVEASMDAFDTFCRDLFGDNHDVKVFLIAYIYVFLLPIFNITDLLSWNFV